MGKYRPIEVIRHIETLVRIDRSLVEAEDQDEELARAIDRHGEVERKLAEHAADLMRVQRELLAHLKTVKKGGDCDE